jgi:hypothetical protein
MRRSAPSDSRRTYEAGTPENVAQLGAPIVDERGSLTRRPQY